MLNIHFSTSLFLSIIVPLILFILIKASRTSTKFVKSYPVIGSLYEAVLNKDRFIEWTSQIVNATQTLTFSLNLFGKKYLITSNAANVQHILKTNFDDYGKGRVFRTLFGDVFGDILFVVDGKNWKVQRQLLSREFSTKYFRNILETTIDDEVSSRLIPFLKSIAGTEVEVDLQDILERFSFDVICRVALGYDPGCLSPSLPKIDFAVEYENALSLSFERLYSFSPYIWKTKRALNIGSEKRLKTAIGHVKNFVLNMAKEKKKQLQNEPSVHHDIMSSLLSSNLPEKDTANLILGLILAGRDTSSSALTWFFWLLSNHREVEREILNEIKGQSAFMSYNDMKKMVYTQASLCESMRYYAPVPLEIKTASRDDVLPDGTHVKKGTKVVVHIHAMGRVEEVWGSDWDKFKPTRWLETTPEGDNKLKIVSRDSYSYPVFLAGPRVCLGKDMAFFQMKKIVVAVLQRFNVVPTACRDVEPKFDWILANRMKGGLKVLIEERIGFT